MSVAEKKAVDEFVQSNPDLQEELVMLQQSILQPDHIVFIDKGSLLQNETAVINIREKLLLHLDNELSPLEKIELEAVINANTDIEKEWNLLQQTKLLPDCTIVFENKKSLYRKEAGKLVAFPWRRALAAAVIIGFGVWGGMVYFNNNNGKVVDSSIAGNNSIKLEEEKTRPAATEATTTIASADENEKELPTTTVIDPVIAERKQQSTDKASKALLPERVMPAIAAVEKSNNLPEPYFDNVNKIESNKTITAHVTTEQQSNMVGNTVDKNMLESTEKQDAANVYAASASFTDSGEESNNHVLFMDEEKIKKTKLGGMLRKVKRVIERNTNIKPGSNKIKVANLEFAIQ